MDDQSEVWQLADVAYKQVVIQSGNELKKYVQFFRVLIDGLKEEAEKSQSRIEEVSLAPEDISSRLGRKPVDREHERKYINKNLLPPLLEDLEVVQPAINSEALRSGIRKRLVPVRVNGENNRVFYGIKLEDLSAQEVGDSNVSCGAEEPEKSVINYRLVKKPKPTLLGKYFSRVSLNKKGLWLYFLIPAVPVLALLFWFNAILYQQTYSHFVLMVLVSVLFWCLWLFIRPFYSLLDSGIAIAPEWMVPLKYKTAQIERRTTDREGPFGRPEKELVFVVYEGDCPVCGSPVNIVQGRGQHKDRLMGQCSANGVEHIFSFDQVSKKGVPLRNDTYTGA